MSLADAPRTLAGVAALYFGHRSTRVLAVLGSIALTARIVVGTYDVADLLVLVAFAIAWPVIEWSFHVLMHRPKLLREHRLHHEQPGVVDHVLFRPAVLVVLALASTPAFVLMLGVPLGLTAAVCFHAGGLLNGWVHLLTHTRYRPRSRLFRWIRRTHYRHHLQDARRGFAFTGPWIDTVFRTRHPE